MEPNANTPAPAPAAPVAPAPAAPAPAPAPTPAAAPTAPGTEPAASNQPAPQAAPVRPGTPTKTPQQLAEDADAAEWAEAEDEIFPGLKSTQKKDAKNEPAKPEKTAEEIAAEATNPAGEEPNAEPGAGDDTAAQGDGTEKNGDKSDVSTDPEAAARESRAQTRAYAQQLETVKTDVRERMYANVPKTLTDRDGDPIASIEDVMKHDNPLTGEAFTEVEAATWLLAAQQQFNQKIAEIDKHIEKVAEINLDLKDQADSITAKYGDYLKANPELRDKIWAKYNDTLQKDPETETIVNAPVSMVEFYDMILADRVKEAAAPVAPAAPEVPAETQEQKTAREAKEKQDAADAKKRKLAGRSDIYAGQAQDTTSDEDKEWAEAEQNVFGDRLK
jgi:hypothetical protein